MNGYGNDGHMAAFCPDVSRYQDRYIDPTQVLQRKFVTLGLLIMGCR